MGWQRRPKAHTLLHPTPAVPAVTTGGRRRTSQRGDTPPPYNLHSEHFPGFRHPQANTQGLAANTDHDRSRSKPHHHPAVPPTNFGHNSLKPESTTPSSRDWGQGKAEAAAT